MAAATGLWNQSMVMGNSHIGARPMADSTGSTGSSSSTSSDSATISANDFLTLLVTEMKNQDPTANTDPNEYINQLVQVNSLQQLISINQNISTALGDSGSGSGTGGTGSGATGGVVSPAGTSGAMPAVLTGPSVTVQKSGATVGASRDVPRGTATIHDIRSRIAAGNLSVPEAKPAVNRLATALGGRVD